MVDSSQIPSEATPEEVTPEMTVNDSASEGEAPVPVAPAPPSETSTELDPEDLAEANHGAGLSLEERPEGERPYDSAEVFIDLPENADDAADSISEPEAALSDAVSNLGADRPDPTVTSSERENSVSAPMESTESFDAPLQPLPEESPIDAVEDESDWDLGALDAAAVDAVQAARSKPNSPVQRLQILAQPALTLWQRLLRGARLRVPQVANLSDGLLSSILVGVLVLLLVLINSLGHRSPATAAAPPPEVISSEQATDSAPATELEPAPLEANPDLERIADIQEQLAEVAASYASDLVVSVQASFAADRLSANLSSGWYRLPRKQQDELAADLLGRSQRLEFTTLELRDPDGMMVARSPVVGSTMVILQRQPPPEVPVPERPRYSITINR